MTRLTVELVGDRLLRNSLDLGGWGNSLKDVLRVVKVDMAVDNTHRDDLAGSERSPGYSYELGREDNVARILRYVRRSC
jgi:hypothetical protein